MNTRLGGDFKDFLFSSLFGEDEPILTSIFCRGVGSSTNQSFSVKVGRLDDFGKSHCPFSSNCDPSF